MDWNMPGMNGLDAVRAIRANSHIARTTTFVMVTALSRDELLAQATDIKIDGLLEKPVSPSAVVDAIMAAISPQGTYLPSRHERQEHPTEAAAQLIGSHVLLVEDNDFNQELAVYILTSVGMMVDIANNGAEAVAMVGQKAYDAVLMDCQMPVMDGYTATLEIRKDARFADLPILAMSANAMAGDKEKCLDVGMNDHIAKPIDINQLFKMLVQWIKPRDLPLALSEPKVAAQETATQVHTLRGVDMAAALKRLNGNKVIYRKLLRMFYERQADVIERIQAAWNQGDSEGVQLTAHTLKSLAGNMGADALFAAAEQLELGLRQGDSAHFQERLAQTAIPLHDLIHAIEHYLALPFDDV
jgi:CheY-like chemotaxis protein